MNTAILTLEILVALNIIIYLFIQFKRKPNQNNKNRKSYPYYFGTKFFATALIPTMLLITLVADDFFQFVIILIYLISLLFLSNRLYHDIKDDE